MYSAPDFVKISVQPTNAFASTSACDPEWYMSQSSLDESCEKYIMTGDSMSYECYVYQDPPN